jgi:hypothetical protein
MTAMGYDGPLVPVSAAGGLDDEAIAVENDGPRPLTERVLDRAPLPRPLARLVWGLAPIAQAVIVTPAMTAAGVNPYGWALLIVAIPFNLVLTACIIHALWASARVASDAGALQTANTAGAPVRRPFSGMGSRGWPLGLTLALALVVAFDAARSATAVPLVLKAVFDVIVYLPIVTWVWTYLMMTVGLSRIGRARLELHAYRGDRSLGLGNIGRLAARGFSAFLLNLLPILVLNVGYGLGIAIGLGFVLAGVASFFASLLGLHRQMRRVRQAEMLRATELYARAFEPLRHEPDLATLQRVAPLLGAAEALERRADGIQTWPFSNAIFARIVIIATSVVTAIVTKLVMTSIGL